MNTFSKLTIAGIVAGTMLATSAFAQVNESIDPGHPRINQVDTRIDNQEQKVQSDEAKGKITAGQAQRDDARLNRIQTTEEKDAAKNGGHLTKREQRRLNRKLNHDNHHINHQVRKDAR